MPRTARPPRDPAKSPALRPLNTAKPLLSLQDISQATGVSVYTLRDEIVRGRLRAFKLAQLYKVRQEDFVAWVAAGDTRRSLTGSAVGAGKEAS